MAYASEDDRARRELENIQYKSNRLTDETLESTRRMVALTQETQEVGVKTLEELDAQGEQLDRVETGLDNINADMKKAERNLTQMEKCCGLCLCPCGRTRSIERDPRYGKAFSGGAYEKEDEVVSSQPRSGGPSGSGRGSGAQQSQGGNIQRITNDAREDEMDENMDLVSNAVSNLKNMAMDMGNELERQNVQLDRINDKAEMNDERIQHANTRAKKIYRNS
ncbi:synaptosomal-associated protein 23-like [Sycon ciliatum]|uniref:synaptosomal-associated protein 23-like n=1 Tax=Sycon ciliatum TaxID=27933 RepID=UPI0020AB7781|eukprot:scpid96731/ scgid23125/ Synaptosomal-associated protein 23; Vesicle-membrane fusion protein SNAP-23